jgi:hypothetical protein
MVAISKHKAGFLSTPPSPPCRGKLNRHADYNHFCSREIDVLFTMHELTMHVMVVAHSSTNMATSYKQKQQLLNST